MIGGSYCAAVSDGTAALRLSLQALEVKPGDEVIVPANTFIATVEAVSHCGAIPVFVDCRADTLNIDSGVVEAAITSRTVGIVPVHLYGQPADMDAIQAIAARHKLWLLEDAAQAHLATYKGRTAGTLGDAAAFSFYPSKNLGAPGEGGAVVTRHADLAARVKKLRDHGSSAKYVHDVIGENARMSTLVAAALNLKLSHLRAWTERRRSAARMYLAALATMPTVKAPVVPAWAEPAWHLFVVHVANRDAVKTALERAHVGVGLHYPRPVHLQKAYSHLGVKPGSMPQAEASAASCLSLPMHPSLTPADVAYVIDALRGAVRI